MRAASLLPAVLLVAAARLTAQDTGVSHQPVSCLVAGKFPRLTACISEPDQVARARVFFRAEGTAAWYHVLMERDAACFAGVLPKPRRDLVGRHVQYYLEADHRTLGAPRTPENAALVVRAAGECTGPLAALAAAGPAAVFPGLPVGFGAGGLGTGTLVAVVGGAAAAGGTAAVVAGGGDAAPEAPAEPGPSTPTTTAPPATTPPVTTPTPTNPGQPLAVTCVARPDNGAVPLTVQFQATASGGSAPAAFRWDFGDGTNADGPAAEHTYRAAGRYAASVRATSGGATESCAQTIAAAVTPTGRVTLKVSKAGSGDGTVSSSPGGIDCGGTCDAEFAQGTTLRLVAAAGTGSAFRGWSGAACGGAGACQLTLSAPVDVTATFDKAPTTPSQKLLTVEKTGQGNGRVTSSPAGIDCGGQCSEQFPTGSVVALAAQPTGTSTFAGWAGACSGKGACNVTLNADRTVTAAFDPPATTTFPLAVQLAGKGTGTVTGTNINCPGDCSETFPENTAVIIQAQAGAQTTFSGWELDCFGQSSACQLAMNGPRTARARFDAQFRLDVSVTGAGHVTGSAGAINCPPSCAVTRVDGSVVVIDAVPNMGATFQGWAGDCSGSATSCQVTLSQDRFVAATFVGGSLAGRPNADAGAEVAWISRLDAAGAAATVRAGERVVAAAAGTAVLSLPAHPGDNQIEGALLGSGSTSGTWRFEAPPGLVEPGSLRPVQGDVLSVEPNAIVFRTSGRAGEPVVFRFRARGKTL